MRRRDYPSDLTDQEWAILEPLQGLFPRLKLIWADSAYKKGGFVEWVKQIFGWEVEIVEHPWSGLRGVWAPKDAVLA